MTDKHILLNNQQPNEIKKLLVKLIKLYNSNSELVDYIYNEDKISGDKKKFNTKKQQ